MDNDLGGTKNIVTNIRVVYDAFSGPFKDLFYEKKNSVGSFP